MMFAIELGKRRLAGCSRGTLALSCGFPLGLGRRERRVRGLVVDGEGGRALHSRGLFGGILNIGDRV